MIWGGDRLKSEYCYSFGHCNCTSGCPCLSSTFVSTTQNPTSLFPSTFEPTLQATTSIHSTQQETSQPNYQRHHLQ